MCSRVAIVGSRAYPALDAVRAYVATLPAETLVLAGGAATGSGVMLAAEEAARARGLPVSTLVWGELIDRGGVVRLGDRLVCFWDTKSRQVAESIHCARAWHVPLVVIGPDGREMTVCAVSAALARLSSRERTA